MWEVKECCYVDDLLAGANNPIEVNQIRNEVTALLKLGGFPITKWKTNGEFKGNIEFAENDEEQSVLGLCWNLATDKLFFKLRDPDEKDITWTKRRILSRVGKLYNPNGCLGPVILQGKIINQELWRDAMNWDDELQGNIKTKWQVFNEDLQKINLISVNRWLGTEAHGKMQIHGFCDASEKGYGAVVYSR